MKYNLISAWVFIRGKIMVILSTVISLVVYIGAELSKILVKSEGARAVFEGGATYILYYLYGLASKP